MVSHYTQTHSSPKSQYKVSGPVYLMNTFLGCFGSIPLFIFSLCLSWFPGFDLLSFVLLVLSLVPSGLRSTQFQNKNSLKPLSWMLLIYLLGLVKVSELPSVFVLKSSFFFFVLSGVVKVVLEVVRSEERPRYPFFKCIPVRSPSLFSLTFLQLVIQEISEHKIYNLVGRLYLYLKLNLRSLYTNRLELVIH